LYCRANRMEYSWDRETGECRINHLCGNEDTAYYTDDFTDAYYTACCMVEWMDSHTVPSFVHCDEDGNMIPWTIGDMVEC